MSPLPFLFALLVATEPPPTVIATQELTPITGAALSRDGRFIAVILDDHAVVVWDARIGQPVKTFTGHTKAVLAVAFSPDGRQLLLGSADTTATLWDLDTRHRVHTFSGHTGSVQAVAFSPDGTRVLTGSADTTAMLWNAETGEPLLTAKGHRKELMAVAFAPDGKSFATTSADTTAALWDATTGAQTFALRGHGEGVSSVAFSTDGSRVATGSWENHGIVWDPATGKQLMKTARHNNDVNAVGLSPDGRRVLTGDREAAVMMWDAVSGEKVRTLLGHTGDIVALVVRDDGRVVLTASRDGTAKLWDLATGRELLTLATDAAWKSWAVVSPEGLFDASDFGRHALGFRFAKGPTAEVDQFFAECFRPGLLAEVCRGERPVPAKPFGRSVPPRVRIVPPTSKAFTAPEATLTVTVTDQGGGVSGLRVDVNGARMAVPFNRESATRMTFRVPLAPGGNKVRVRAASADGSWESTPSEIELTHANPSPPLGRFYVVAVGDDARELGESLRSHRGNLFDRVDVVPLTARETTKTVIADTVHDVAELTRPQDTFAVLLCDRGGEPVAADPSLTVNKVAAAMGTAAAQKRLLVIYARKDEKMRDEFVLRGAVERLARSQGIHVLAAGDSRLNHTLRLRLIPKMGDAQAPLTVSEWFETAQIKSTPLRSTHYSTQAKSFPILMPDR
ncbi:WD40 repeat domain-containing protein [Limnoglobus roseus]|uniref:WD40 repeat domain-containing protein n=1 Tax=Limnoglobus roseus TaxID=2598579 RepID=A0A5C1ABT2_9BACT|nr:WD40 repeat domain-containing protein [Limnoglobus roseus]QEL16045.1 WD40 repeat domain-containing protein [Limnoglobus roseus]